jgi:hypothetical protein
VAEAQEQLDDILRQAPVAARPTSDYQVLLEETETDDEKDPGDNLA